MKRIEWCVNCGSKDIPGERVKYFSSPDHKDKDDFCAFCICSRGAHKVRFSYSLATDIDKTEAQTTATLAKFYWINKEIL